MADAIVSAVLQQLVTIVHREVEQEVRLVVGVEQEVENMTSTFQTIQAVLVDAESKQYLKEGKAVKVWLDKLKHISYDVEDVLDEWNTAILKSQIDEKSHDQTPSTRSLLGKVCSCIPSPCSCFGGVPLPLRHNIAHKIEELNKRLNSIAREKDGFAFIVGLSSNVDLKLERPRTTSLIDESDICGRDDDKRVLIDRLLLSDNKGEGGSGNGIPLIAIVGMGGLGKTTLAQLAFNDYEVKKHFPHRIWVCVSDPFDELSIAKVILETLKGTPSESKELEIVLQQIRQHIEGKKFLLVLDDVWNEDEQKWKPLKLSLTRSSQESKILVTTRKEKVACVMGCTRPLISIGVLSNQDSWSLFSKIAFFDRSIEDCRNLESIGRKFVEKCGGLPLAIKSLASLLRFKKTKEQWQRILDSEMWKLEDEIFERLYAPLLLSYYDLPMTEKQCFRYCAIFPKDHKMKREELIKLWMAQGFLGETCEVNDLEIKGEECFDNLAIRGFFQEFVYDEDDGNIIECKMHDIVHDFAQFLTKTECLLVTGDAAELQRGVESCHGNGNVRHLTLLPHGDHVPEIVDSIKVKGAEKLRSFLVVKTLLASFGELCHPLINLRMLRIRTESRFDEPINVATMGKLTHLRYLSFGYCGKLIRLPEAICDLCNLQTLNIRWCDSLKELPRGMEKLINLRHLQNKGTESIRFMPKGMERLTSLQTLEEFVVNESERDSFRLQDLGKLIHLRGHLEIRYLGSYVGEGKPSEARLSTIVGLRKLTLNFDLRGDEASILQTLEPPQHLERLYIENCKGTVFPFPNWMMPLTPLKSVTFSECYGESLPPMGELPSLESLTIYGTYEVKKVGEEFYGVGVETPSSSITQNIAYFPSLKYLEFKLMVGWEEWECELRSRGGGGGEGDSSSSNTPIIIMPKLQSLVINDCRMLKTLPRHILQSRALQELLIIQSHILEGRYNKETGDDWPSISHIPHFQIIDFQYNSLFGSNSSSEDQP